MLLNHLLLLSLLVLEVLLPLVKGLWNLRVVKDCLRLLVHVSLQGRSQLRGGLDFWLAQISELVS